MQKFTKSVLVFTMFLSLVGCTCVEEMSIATGGDVTTGEITGTLDVKFQSRAECKAQEIIAKAMDKFYEDWHACTGKPQNELKKCRQAALDAYEPVVKQMRRELQELGQIRGSDAKLREQAALERMQNKLDAYLNPNSEGK